MEMDDYTKHYTGVKAWFRALRECLAREHKVREVVSLLKDSGRLGQASDHLWHAIRGKQPVYDNPARQAKFEAANPAHRSQSAYRKAQLRAALRTLRYGPSY